MELELSRVDYTVVGLTSTNCLKLLPSGNPKHQQKVAVADHDGVLQVFAIKKEDVQLSFKTLPGPKVSSLQLGGATGTVCDKIFITAENEVKGYTRKGKLFLNFDTNMTEPIVSMFVVGSDLLLCGKHVYNHFRDCKDVGSYLCGDRIVDVVALMSDKTHRLRSIIACEGRMLRVLEHSRVISSIEIESSPTVLHIYKVEKDNFILFGTVDGRIGVIDVDKAQASTRWLLTRTLSPVSCIDSYDMTKDEIPNLLVGRQDGSIEVYAVNIRDESEVPLLLYSHNCGSSVTALQGGIVGNEGYDEVLVSTYTGRIFGLTTEIIDKNVGGDSTVGSYVLSPDTSQKIIKLKSEIENLEKQVAKEREKYQMSTQAIYDGLSAIPMLAIKDSMILNKADSTYCLTLEVPTAIDNVLLQSNVPVDLLDVEKNSAVVSHSECEPQNGNYLLATYRCQINTNRLEIKIRSIEGQYGKLQAYITPAIQPKCCQLKQYDIKPLSLHTRCHSFEDDRPYNTLTLKGPFSLYEIHSWIMQCFPEVPEKPQTDGNFLIFQSTFIDTIVKCLYSKGEAEFRSDNVSTISILKEFLSKEATKKKIKLEMNHYISSESIPHTIKLLEPKLLEQTDLNKKLSLIEALHELEINDEENIAYLSEQYKDLLANEKTLKAKLNSKPNYLDRLYGVITDLYIDSYKFKGQNVKARIPQLLATLENYSYDNLIHFFQPESSA